MTDIFTQHATEVKEARKLAKKKAKQDVLRKTALAKEKEVDEQTLMKMKAVDNKFAELKELLVVEQKDTTVVLIGDQGSGKTTLLNHFAPPKSKTKQGKSCKYPDPTVALSYTYARHSPVGGEAENVAHLYEVGGGRKLSKLLSVPLTAETLNSIVVVVTVDLSTPGHALSSLLWWLAKVRSATALRKLLPCAEIET